jgi:hypothetical protein
MVRYTALAALLFALGGLVLGTGAQAQERSNNWAGAIYQSPDLGQSPPPVTFSSVTAMWTQPTVFCTVPYAKVSIWVGFDGWTGSTSQSVEQAGTIAVCGAAATPLYYKVWWEMYAGANSSGGEGFIVSPGDLIQASVIYSNGPYMMNVTDVTTGQSFGPPKPQTCDPSVVCNRGTAEWIVERPGHTSSPLAEFGTVKFANLGFNSSGGDPTGSLLDMIEKGTDSTLSTCKNAPLFWPPREFTAPQIIIVLPIVCTWQAAG